MQATEPIPTFHAPKAGLIATLALAIAVVGGVVAIQVGGLGLGTGAADPGAAVRAAGSAADGSSAVGPQAGRQGRLAR